MGKAALEAFAREVGDSAPVAIVGGRTQWALGGPVHAAAREVKAPAGIVEYEPAEMVVRCRAGTTVAELDAALAAAGQMVPLDPADPVHATVGGVLAAGLSGVRRLRYGPVRDTLLEVTYVSAAGTLVRAGGPVVKNVTGYDLCRLLVGSLGTLGFMAEVVLRAQPRPPVSVWLAAEADPFEARARLFRPSSILWDGTTTWTLVEGHAAALGAGWREADGPPAIPQQGRLSVRPGELRTLQVEGPFVAEVGVGTVHTGTPAPSRPPHPTTSDLHRRIKAAFDPAGRLNPGRTVVAA